ncbi:MAG: hypothetical protein EP344_18515 [Bacteroidetes bacterium]|nr:MAG: hypothetical protein EP344_18515 [Bacteroidota bacterium]
MFNQKSNTCLFLSLGLFLTLFSVVSCTSKKTDKNAPPPPVLAIDSVTGAPIRLPNPWKDAGCELVTDDEIVGLFDIDVNKYAFNARSLPGRGFCLRSWLKPDWKERESGNEKAGAEYVEFKNTLVTQVLDYGNEHTSREQFDMLRRDQRNVFEEDVPDVGDDAIWSTVQRALVFKRGHLVVKVTLEYTDEPHKNLELAKKVAKLALQKMN